MYFTQDKHFDTFENFIIFFFSKSGSNTTPTSKAQGTSQNRGQKKIILTRGLGSQV